MKTTRVLFSVFSLSVAASGKAGASVTAFSQTFYSTNNNIALSSGNVVWTTLANSNSELHTNFSTTTVNVGETLRVAFTFSFNEPQNDGGIATNDGFRVGLLNLTTPTNADGAHTSTTATGFSSRFNIKTATTVAGGDNRYRTLSNGTSINYTTSSGVYGGANAYNGFGLQADGTSYNGAFEVTRLNATDLRFDITLGGVTRSMTQTSAPDFGFNSFVFSKISDQDPFKEAATVTFSSFSIATVPEPAAPALALLSMGALLTRRRRV